MSATSSEQPASERERLREATTDLAGQCARLVHNDAGLVLPLVGAAADLAARLAHFPVAVLWTAVPLAGPYLLAVVVHALTCRPCPHRKEGSS